LVAEVQGRAAAIGACEDADDCISDIWVAPAFEGQGAGSALIRALEVQILSRGYTEARIQVAAANARALGLYRHLGYRQLWRRIVSDPVLGTQLEKIGLARRL
jgi:ribosomal-protein-alanine N-acetyltransferase